MKAQVDYVGAQSNTSFNEDAEAIPSEIETFFPK